MGADGRDRGAHGRARRRRGAAGHGDGVLRARQGARDGARRARRHPPRDRRARLRHAGAHHRGRDRRAAGGGDALLPRGGHPRAARGGGRRADAHAAAWTSPPSACSWPTAPSRSSSSPSSRPASRATRSSTPTPASRSTSRPSAGSARRRSRCRCARSSDFSFALEDLEARLSDAHEARHPQLAAEPDRRRHAGGRPRGRGRPHPADATWVLTDEVYARLTTATPSPPSPSVPGMLERTVLLDGFSKTYAMTGWRCGYAAVPDALVEPLTRFFVNSTSCVPPFVQYAGVAALTGPQDDVTAMVAEFAARRDLVVDGLNALPGVSCLSPRGAFYVFPNVADTPVSAEELADRLLEEAGVAAAGRHGLRGAGRRPPAPVLRELPGEPDARARAHGRLPARPLALDARGVSMHARRLSAGRGRRRRRGSRASAGDRRRRALAWAWGSRPRSSCRRAARAACRRRRGSAPAEHLARPGGVHERDVEGHVDPARRRRGSRRWKAAAAAPRSTGAGTGTGRASSRRPSASPSRTGSAATLNAPRASPTMARR